MAEFTPIATQEDFDRAISSRLERERNTIRNEFKDYEEIKNNLTAAQQSLAAEQTKSADLAKQIAELTGKVKAYETDSVKTRIGLELGLPMELIGRISGETEDAIKADAEKLAKLLNPSGRQPLFNPESNPGDANDAAYREMLRNMKK